MLLGARVGKQCPQLIVFIGSILPRAMRVTPTMNAEDHPASALPPHCHPERSRGICGCFSDLFMGSEKGPQAHFSPRGPRRQVFVAGVEVRGGESKACPERSRMGTCFCFPFLLLGRERDPLVRTGDGSTIASRTPRPEVPVPEQLQAAEIAVNRRQAPPILQILVCAKLELACFYLFVRQRLEIGFGLRASSFLPQGRALTTVIFSATHNVCAQSSSPRCALV